MEWKDDSAITNTSTATIDASLERLLTEMRRLGDRIEGRCGVFEHAYAPATIYDKPAVAEESAFDTEPLFDDEVLVFDAVPIFDEEPIADEVLVFDAVPIFDEEPIADEVRVFDAVSIFDEGPDDSTTASYDVDISGEEPDDFNTVGCRDVFSGGLGITTAAAAHNSTTSSHQAFSTSSSDKEIVFNYSLAAAASVRTTCSMKCPRVVVNVMASNEVCAVVQKLAVIPAHAAATPAAITAIPCTINADAPSTCSTKCSSSVLNIRAPAAVQVVPEEDVVVISNKLSVTLDVGAAASLVIAGMPTDMELAILLSAKYLRKCLNLFVIVPVSESSLKFALSVSLAYTLAESPTSNTTTACIGVLFDRPNIILNAGLSAYWMCVTLVSEISCDVSSVNSWLFSLDWVETQPRPPPLQLGNFHDGLVQRPQPWPSFIMGDMSSATWSFSLSLKPPWPSFTSSDGCSVSWDIILVWKPPWSLHHQQNISCIPTTVFREFFEACVLMGELDKSGMVKCMGSSLFERSWPLIVSVLAASKEVQELSLEIRSDGIVVRQIPSLLFWYCQSEWFLPKGIIKATMQWKCGGLCGYICTKNVLMFRNCEKCKAPQAVIYPCSARGVTLYVSISLVYVRPTQNAGGILCLFSWSGGHKLQQSYGNNDTAPVAIATIIGYHSTHLRSRLPPILLPVFTCYYHDLLQTGVGTVKTRPRPWPAFYYHCGKVKLGSLLGKLKKLFSQNEVLLVSHANWMMEGVNVKSLAINRGNGLTQACAGESAMVLYACHNPLVTWQLLREQITPYIDAQVSFISQELKWTSGCDIPWDLRLQATSITYIALCTDINGHLEVSLSKINTCSLQEYYVLRLLEDKLDVKKGGMSGPMGQQVATRSNLHTKGYKERVEQAEGNHLINQHNYQNKLRLLQPLNPHLPSSLL